MSAVHILQCLLLKALRIASLSTTLIVPFAKLMQTCPMQQLLSCFTRLRSLQALLWVMEVASPNVSKLFLSQAVYAKPRRMAFLRKHKRH